MNGVQRIDSLWLGTDPALAFAPAGDVNGDGDADLLVRNASTATTSVWLMSGRRVIGTSTLDTTGTWTYSGP